MAKAATSDSVGAAKREPQWRSAVQLIRGGINDVKGKIDSLGGKVNEHWATISGGYKVDKAGAKMFQKLDQMEESKRVATWRALINMVKHSDWTEMDADLIDMAEGEIIDPRLWGTPEAEEKVEEAKVVKKAAKPAGGPKAHNQAMADAKRHLSVVPAPKKDGVDPDDDKDLAGEE